MAFQFTDQNFVEETRAGFAVIDFYADWCGPCKMMMPIFEEVAEEYKGKVKMGKMNVDENQKTPGEFGVSGIPTIVFLKNGEEVSRLTGFQSEESLTAKIKEAFGD